MLIDDIISLLSDDKGNLTDALLKTKVFLHQIGKKELVPWVNHELTGYPTDIELPAYRMLSSRLYGNASNMAWRFGQQPLPIFHLNDEERRNIVTAKFHQSISMIEQFGTEGVLQREIPPEFYAKLNKGLGNGYQIERAWCETSILEGIGILTQVRSRLLDFMLELKDSLGDVDSDEDVREKLRDVRADDVFHRSVFGNIGDNATIIIGNSNKTNIEVKVFKGDMKSLTEALSTIGVEQHEIENLRQAVSEDGVEGKEGLGVNTKTAGWLIGALKNIGKSGLKVGSDVATTVITQALKSYYGLE